MTDQDSETEENTMLFTNNYSEAINDLRPIDCSRRTSVLSIQGMKRSISNLLRPSNTARMQYGVDTSFKSRLQQYFIENQKSSLRIRLFNVFIKVLSCALYCVRVIQDNGDLPDHVNAAKRDPGDIQLEKLTWVECSYELWFIQTVVAFISIIETILIFYISYQGNIVKLLYNVHFLLEIITSCPFIISIFNPNLRQLFVPAFLNCWLAKSALQAMMNDLNRMSSVRQSALFTQMSLLFTTLLCLIFTWMCMIEHFQRGGGRKFDLFTSFYFVMVTLSTVGYGDFYPDNWMSRLCVVILICVALIMLPSQLESLGQTWSERQKSGGEYSSRWAAQEHVVVTITHLEVEFVRDFLDEFYAHPENQNIDVVLLSPGELDNSMRLLLKIPLWSQKVFYVRGSALRDEDLERSKLSTAKACFILAARHVNRKIFTDEHTILRSWAVKDFAPNVKQYVQIFRPETKMHIEHAEVLVCEDEFKYALLANNCICPGISTFITLLVHTSRGEEGKKSSEPWHKVYGFHSGNELYHIRVEDSKFFGDFIGKSFTYASFHAHKSYGIGLIGVKPNEINAKMRLNPGTSHVLEASDILYYMGLTNEESLYDFRKDLKTQQRRANVASSIANIGAVAIDVPSLEEGRKKPNKKRGLLQKSKATDEVRLIEVPNEASRRPSIAMVMDAKNSSSDDDDDEQCDTCRGTCIQDKLQRSYPQVRTYIGTSNTICHMMKEKRPFCCLQLDKACLHSPNITAHSYNWRNRPIILASDRPSSGMYNLIIPLRAYYRPVHTLHPIIVLLELEDTETEPSSAFLDAISYFPEVYWMKGKISNLDKLLIAGVSNAEQVVVVKETATLVEEHFADCSTIITVQKIHRMFPTLRMITELTHASNMRFVQFNPNDPYSLAQSRFEKDERKRGSHMPFMFRLPFAQGGVFSANMLDRLLYQSLIKPYVVQLTRLLLGIDQSSGSGFLTSFVITSDDLWIKTYGRLYQQLCSTVSDIPIGIFRTKVMDSKTVSLDLERRCCSVDYEQAQYARRKDMYDHVKNKMRNLGMTCSQDGLDSYDKSNVISFVIINPSIDLQLEEGDIVYVIRSPLRENAKTSKVNPRRGLRRGKNVRETMDSADIPCLNVPT
ncbi:unnamed protein product [Auanema sp. JU1783]|nr:unnamed protein product [Auanema sp. JU1783]